MPTSTIDAVGAATVAPAQVPVDTSGGNPAPASSAPRASLQQVVQRLSDTLRTQNQRLDFSIDSASDRVVVTVRDADTGQVLRQIPSAEVLALRARV